MTVDRRIDAVPVIAPHPSADPLRRRLDELLTRCFYSGAGYVFESDPHVVPEDGPLLTALAEIRQEDRRHAHALASLIQARGGVPQPGVFPWWNQDLNYLTVPTVARFVLESMEEEAGHYTELVGAWPKDDPGGLAALSSVRADKVRQVTMLAPLVVDAERREAETYKAQIAAVKKARDTRIAKEKAAADAARKAKQAAKSGAPAAAKPAAVVAAPSAVLLDPKEAGISPKERARRTIARFRAAGQGPAPVAGAAAPAAASAPAPAAAPAASGAALPDPNEPGISPKEKAKRQIAITRAKAAGGAPDPAPVAAAAPTAAAPAVELADPNEPGISPKEKAKRQIAITRAKAAGGTPAPAPVAAAAPAAAAAAVELADPNEPGISPKEKAKRQIAITRAKAAGGAPAAAAPPAGAAPEAAAPAAPPVPPPAAAPVIEDLGDPDEPGLSPKEKARRKVARMRANKA